MENKSFENNSNYYNNTVPTQQNGERFYLDQQSPVLNQQIKGMMPGK